MGSVSTSIRGVRFTLYILGGNEWFRFPRHSVSGSTLLDWPGTRGVERVPPQGAPGACGGPCFCVVFAFLAWPCTGSPKVPSDLTLRQTAIQDHERASLPTDAAAVFEWGLDTSFTSRDKPRLSIAMVFTANGERVVRRYRLVIAQKTRLKLNPQVAAALTSHASAHHLTTSHFFPCSIDRECLFGYAADGYRSPLWLCAAYEGSPVLVHRQRATKVIFHKAVQERRLLVLPGIHYFDAHRLQPELLAALEAGDGPRTTLVNGPDGAQDMVEDSFSDDDTDTTDLDVEADDLPWCPPTPDPADDPTETEIASAADNLETMMNSSQPKSNIFFLPSSLGALPHLWLQARTDRHRWCSFCRCRKTVHSTISRSASQLSKLFNEESRVISNSWNGVPPLCYLLAATYPIRTYWRSSGNLWG